MRGLYINCDDSKIPVSKKLSSQYSREFIFPEGIDKGKVVYCPVEWPEEPIVQLNGHTFIAYGWFIYGDTKNDLNKLAQDILSEGVDCLNQIEAGVFSIYWFDGEKARVITDPLGISTHYIDKNHSKLTVAPSVKALFEQKRHSVNKSFASILEKKHHLFGDYTLYDGIQRLTPGSIISLIESSQYFSLDKGAVKALSELTSTTKKLSSYWPKKQRILPLSSGLDSRLILASTEFFYGFTYGPDNSPEINIASQFKEDFEQYYTYDFEAPDEHELEKGVLNEMGFGVVRPIPRLFTNYVHIKDKFNQAIAFFDGYLGDSFQRATYITHKGVQAELCKLFPISYRLFTWSAENILKKRYKELSDSEFSLLLKDFIERTKSLPLDDYQKVTFYESLYGRGARYTAFSCNILAAQVFTVVSPFASKTQFMSFIFQSYEEAVSYKGMCKLWRNVPRKYTQPKVESGYTPTSNVLVIPFIQIVYRLMFHFIPSRANYGIKLRKNKNI